MDFKELKQLIEKGGGKIIVVENEEPILVTMSYEEYKQLLSQKSDNQEVQAQAYSSSKETEIRQEHRAEVPPAYVPPRRRTEEPGAGELTIDDLPL